MQKKSLSSVRVFYPKFNRDELNAKLPLVFVDLFGSYAKNNYIAFSDIDLIVIYEGEQREDAYSVIKKTLSIPFLEPHVHSKDEYGNLKETINNIIKDGIIYGKI